MAARPQPDAVVFHGQAATVVERGQTDHDALGTAVFDGVVHGLLRDVKQMRGHDDVAEQHRLVAHELARHGEEILDFAGKPPEGRHQTVGVRDHGQEAARQLARPLNRRVHQLHDLCGFGRLWQRVVFELLLQHFAHERRAGQVLPQPIV